MAGLLRHGQTLLDQSAATDADVTGTAYRIKPEDADATEDKDVTWKAWVHFTQAGGATSPTVDVDIETSEDKTNWVQAVSATALTADGSKTEILAISTLMPWVRVKTVLGGGTKPTHTAKVKLMADAPFTLVAA